MLRDTGPLQSLITTDYAMACDCLDTSDERLIRGKTREVNKISLVRVKLNSKQVNRFDDHWNTRRYTCWL